MTKILGIDYGKVRIGLAISSDTKTMAFPFKTIIAEKDTEKTIAHLLKELGSENISSFVIGLPLLMNGTDSDMTREVRAFAKALEEATGKTVDLWDERLTSKEIEKLLIESDMKRKKRSKILDTLSATLILQSYLDRKK